MLAVQVGYYKWWVEHSFGPYAVDDCVIPFRFCICIRPVNECGVETAYRDPIHIDVFRIIPKEILGQDQLVDGG